MNPKIANSIEYETRVSFLNLSQQAKILVDSSKVINPNGSFSYNLPEKDKRDIEKKFKDLIKKVESEVDKDIKNQDWGKTISYLNFMKDFIYSYDGQIANNFSELKMKVENDFVSHVNLTKPGVYTLRGSRKVYVISYSDSRDLSDRDSNAKIFLLQYLKVNSFTIIGFGWPIASNFISDKEVYDLFTFTDGKSGIILDDGTKLMDYDIADKLENDHRFLPLK